MDISEECEKIQSHLLSACGTMGSQALLELRDPVLRLSLLRQCPAEYDSTVRHPEGKALFLRQGRGGFSALLSSPPFTAKVIKHRSDTQSDIQTQGVCKLPRQGHRLVALRPPLIRIPQQPEYQRGIAMANHPRVLAM